MFVKNRGIMYIFIWKEKNTYKKKQEEHVEFTILAGKKEEAFTKA